jgi:thiol-disulfide isomerase/thioredoxin
MYRFWHRAWIACALTCSLLGVSPAQGGSPLAPSDGRVAPPLALQDIQGRRHTLEGYRGSVIVVNFWATWCEPCRREMPSIQRLRDKLSDKPFVVLAVNVDEPEARVRQFLKTTGLELPILLDPNKKVTRDWGARILPVTYIVDRDGRVRYRLVGDLDWSSDTVVGVISQLLAGG